MDIAQWLRIALLNVLYWIPVQYPGKDFTYLELYTIMRNKFESRLSRTAHSEHLQNCISVLDQMIADSFWDTTDVGRLGAGHIEQVEYLFSQIARHLSLSAHWSD
jgi:hypothetical protein